MWGLLHSNLCIHQTNQKDSGSLTWLSQKMLKTERIDIPETLIGECGNYLRRVNFSMGFSKKNFRISRGMVSKVPRACFPPWILYFVFPPKVYSPSQCCYCFLQPPIANIRHILIGMPHRGRLNLLTDLLSYPPRAFFHKVKGNSEFPEWLGVSGDVISHLGISTALRFRFHLK